MDEKKGYFYVRQDEEDESKWNIHRNEYYEGYPVVASFETEEKADFSAYYHYNRPIREKLISDLLDELVEVLVVERSYFSLKSFEYLDPTYKVTFTNIVGTEFTYRDVYFEEKKLEVMQSVLEIKI